MESCAEVATTIEDLVLRTATPADAPSIIANVAAGIDTYRDWAPSSWAPPAAGTGLVERVGSRLADDEVWCLLALDGLDLVGHVALSPVTAEDPEPAPPGLANLWQMFVRRSWQGRGLAPRLMRAVIDEAEKRRYQGLRLWTPQGAGQARRFYEREGWVHTGRVRRETVFGLPLVEYRLEVGPEHG
jgi:GNAT superfamily N-acetyltransferase